MVLATSKISMHICKMLSLQPKKSTKKGKMYQTTLIQHIIVSFDRSPLWEVQSSPKRNCLSICLCGVCLHVY